MIELFMMEESTCVLSPIVTLGPIIEFFTEQPFPMLTGWISTVFSYSGHCSVRVLNFLSNVALDSSNVSLRPQSNQLSTLNARKCAPFLIMQSSASVMLY